MQQQSLELYEKLQKDEIQAEGYVPPLFKVMK
jgi:hypothetical protein